jgi:glycosyltransferase involved in cell wall biosynthesis
MVIQFLLGNWSDAQTCELKKKFIGVDFIELSALRSPIFQWLLISIIEKLLYLIPLRLLSLKYLSFSLSKRSLLINNELEKFTLQFDWVIAHNPPAFFPAYVYAKKNNSKLGFDIEDYHPGEDLNEKLSSRMLIMMVKLLPKLNYCSFAAPLIQMELESKILYKSPNWFTVINGFSQKEFISPKSINSPKIKLVWFSQNISKGRGLEKFLTVLNEFDNEFELNLVGSLSEKSKNFILQSNKMVVIHEPMSQRNLHEFLSSCHVGLALDPPVNKNRELAITNKIIAYAQSGLFIISMSAAGQNAFLHQSDLKYAIVNDDFEEIRTCLAHVIELFENNKIDRNKQFKIAEKYSWESINKVFLNVWK